MRRKNKSPEESSDERESEPVRSYQQISQNQIEIVEEGLMGLMPNTISGPPVSVPPPTNSQTKNFQQNRSSARMIVISDDEDQNQLQNQIKKHQPLISKPIKAQNQKDTQPLSLKKEDHNNQLQLSIQNQQQNNPLNQIYSMDEIDQFCLTSVKKDPNWDKPRFMIQTVIINNFKSFSGKVEITGMRSGYNAIVGANGSGKSNLVDALLFAFGYNSNIMRHDKNRSLITHSEKEATEGYVEIIYHMASKNEPTQKFVHTTQESKRTIKRTIKHDGTTAFHVDGVPMSSKEAKSFIHNLGIDLTNNRFLILQGQVERIAMMNPKGNKQTTGMLQYLEQIIGTKQYGDLVDELKPELEEIRQEESAGLQELAMLKRTLSEDEMNMNEAIVYYNSIKKQMKLDDLLVQLQLYQIKEESKELANKIVFLNNQNQKIYEHNQRVEKRKERRNRGMHKQGEGENKKEKVPLMSIQQLEERKQMVTRKCQIYDKQIQDLIDKDSMNRTQLNELLKDFDTEVQHLQRLYAKQSEFSFQFKLCETHYPNIFHEVEVMQRKVNHIRKKLIANGSIDRFTTDFIHNIQKVKNLESNISKMRSDKRDIESNIESYQVKIRESLKEIALKQEQLNELVERKGKCDQTLKLIDNQYKEIVKKSDALNIKHAQQRRRQFQIQQLLRKKRQTASKFTYRNAMTERLDRAKIPGVFGRLGSLGECTPQFDEIITSTTFTLDNIVVKDYATAEKVIQFARREDLGRVTCIIIEVIKQNEEFYMNRQFKPIPHAVRLFDQVTTRSYEAKLAFYFTLKDTLFVKDQNKFFEISNYNNQRRRVITYSKANTFMLKEASGIMSSRVKRRGGFGASLSYQQTGEQETKELESELKKEREKNFLLDEEKREMLGKVNTVFNEKSYIQKQIVHLQIQIKRIKDGVYNSTQYNIKKTQQSITALRNKFRLLQQKITNEQSTKNEIEQRDNLQKVQIIADVGLQSLISWKLMIDYQYQIKMSRKEIDNLDVRKRLLEARRQAHVKQRQPNDKRMLFIFKQFNRLKQARDELRIKAEELMERKIRLLYVQHFIQCAAFPRWLAMYLEKVVQIYEQGEDQTQDHLVSQEADLTGKIQQLLQQLAEQGALYQQTYGYLQKLRAIWENSQEEFGFLNHVDQWNIFNFQVNYNSQDHQIKCLKFLEQPRKGKSYFTYEFDPNKNLSQQFLKVIVTVKEELIKQWKESKKVLSLEKYKQKSAFIIKQKYLTYKDQQQLVKQLTQDKEELIEEIDNLHFTRLTKFNEGFEPVAKQLKKIYSELSVNGDITLMSINKTNPFESGVLIKAKPPKKGWKEMSKLSGGQKTLASLSLIFALQAYKPSPLYMLDEVDAALDVHNTEVISKFIKRQSSYAQFIVISLRPDTFTNCDDIVGIYKHNNKGTRGVMASSQKDSYPSKTNVPSLRLKLQSKNVVVIHEKDSVDIQDICDPTVTDIFVKQSEDKWIKLKLSERKRFVWRNFLEYDYKVNDLWLNRNGWYWKTKDVSLESLQRVYRVYWIKFLNEKKIKRVEERKELTIGYEELEMTFEERELIKSNNKLNKKQLKQVRTLKLEKVEGRVN